MSGVVALWRCYVREGRAFRSTGSIGASLLAQQPLSDGDYCKVRELSVGETFIDADGDKWVRTK